MKPVIRAAALNDAAILSELGAVTFRDTFSAFHTADDMNLYLKKAYDPELIRNNLHNRDIAYHIAESDGNPIGYTKLLLHAMHPKLEGSSIELEKIYVLKPYLDKHVGKALMQHAIAFSKAHGYKNLFLGVWQENERAVNFYRKSGFDVFDTRTFQLGETLCDDYLMYLDLSN